MKKLVQLSNEIAVIEYSYTKSVNVCGLKPEDTFEVKNKIISITILKENYHHIADRISYQDFFLIQEAVLLLKNEKKTFTKQEWYNSHELPF